MRVKDTFCSYCGSKHIDGMYPKTCVTCGIPVWDNPAPVAVLLIEHKNGVYLTRRAIEPGKGLLALPGGYMIVGETWQEAAAREAMEEIQIVIDPKEISLVTVKSSSNSRSLLVIGYTRITDVSILPFVKNEETEERVLVHNSVELAFPTHTDVLATLFDSRHQKCRP